MENPDTITIAVARHEEVRADKVDVHVVVKGYTLVTGNAALKDTKEVNQLVCALREIGLTDADVSLQGTYAESSASALGRLTSASYYVRVQCNKLEALADILGVVAGQKHASLDQLGWRYPDDRRIRSDWLRSCLVEAKEKASNVASGLGVNLLGVHTFSEKWFDSEQLQRPELNEPAGSVKLALAGRARVDPGFPLSHFKRIELQIEVQFRVSPFTVT